ncbi:MULTISPECIES: hypothetical protein [Pantoea]|uniref:Uncharacterized protein n=1 Tax=Candidatus Pantoea gossypiicola TaxID=2608008 RepID=A0AB34CGN4_9GAMM|nr:MULTISPECIES: hypothetical protein [Pantoea]KAA5928560.1 hypothetical protein F3I59_12445 [Pantoea sp. VH_8]KAA5933845.1 hypothetical protein F3I58_13375 [Pantoea sp. VH_4]KAA5985893.1 hypothetical protein F3I49_12045 [Pantoea sp. M_4]KAA6123300.1 hypothetical protein F3I20_14420 [Pantoea gossypiicola]
MSFESEALAHDELSLLDLFGPDASPRAQNIVQAAAERSMDEMAEVINAGNTAALAAELDAITAKSGAIIEPVAPSEYGDRKDIYYSIPGLDDVGLKAPDRVSPTAESKEGIKDAWAALRESTGATHLRENADEQMRMLITHYFSLPLPTQIAWARFPDVLASEGLRKGFGTAAGVGLIARDEALKESLVHQLTEQLNAAIARGVDLSKVSVVLNAPNPESQRIEPVCIFADAAAHVPRPLIVTRPRKAATKKY